jgi:hypothetical protein
VEHELLASTAASSGEEQQAVIARRRQVRGASMRHNRFPPPRAGRRQSLKLTPGDGIAHCDLCHGKKKGARKGEDRGARQRC